MNENWNSYQVVLKIRQEQMKKKFKWDGSCFTLLSIVAIVREFDKI